MELSETDLMKLASRVDVELSQEDVIYFSENLIKRKANHYASMMAIGERVNIKADVKAELKHQLARRKADIFEKLNNFIFCEKRQMHVNTMKKAELIF